MFKISARGLGLLGAALVVGAGCMDLDVTNVNAPDRERALADAGDLEALIGGTFSVFFNALHGDGDVVTMFPNYGTEMTATTNVAGFWTEGQEPRQAYNNAPDIPVATGPAGPRDFWQHMSEVAASAHDGLRTIADIGSLVVDGDTVTARAQAFAKFMQGAAWGYMAMLYDSVVVISESVPLSGDIREQVFESLLPWEEARDSAIAALEATIAIAEQNSFTFEDGDRTRLFFAGPTDLTNDDLVRLANTMAARFLVLSARTPQERAQVDWNRVLQYTQNGLTSDVGTKLLPSIRTSTYYLRAQSNTPGCLACFRLDPRLIGQADTSGAYQAWLDLPLQDRTRFDIETPDRRITGATPTSSGAYTRYRADNNGFRQDRGTYFFSAYQWGRHANEVGVPSVLTGADQGTAVMASVDENNLLQAEAYIYLDDPDEAANLINLTRTRAHTLPDGVNYPGLPAVTAAGVPQSADCVPRTDAGQCGDLMVALRYERMVELIGLDAIRGYADSRGFGLLPDGSWVQLPIPGNELQVLGLPTYSYGGVGTPFGAVYAPTDMTNVP